ncbi:hypothetical protein PFISCL1PPCAC_5492, partial [Pristionchus fissidentatus]
MEFVGEELELNQQIPAVINELQEIVSTVFGEGKRLDGLREFVRRSPSAAAVVYDTVIKTFEREFIYEEWERKDRIIKEVI